MSAHYTVPLQSCSRTRASLPCAKVIDLLIFQIFEEWEEGEDRFGSAVEPAGFDDGFFDAALDEFLGWKIEGFGCEAVEVYDFVAGGCGCEGGGLGVLVFV